MVRGMGEASFDELLPWLMSTLTSETSSVDRSGAAQVPSGRGFLEPLSLLGIDTVNLLFGVVQLRLD